MAAKASTSFMAKFSSKRELTEEVQNPVLNASVVNAADSDSLVLVKPDLESINRQIASRSPVAVSTRVIVIEVQAFTCLPVGTAWIYLYEGECAGIKTYSAKRLLKFTNNHLAKLICKPGELRYFFPDVTYDPKAGTEPIQDAFLQDIRTLLDRKRTAVERETKRTSLQNTAKPVPSEAPKSSAPTGVTLNQRAAPAPTTTESKEATRHTELAANAPQSPAAGAAHRPLNLAVEGQIFEGVVVNAGQTWKNGPKGPYKVFCLTINDGRTETPLNGTELERLVRDNNIQIGDKVRVVSMGRCPVDVPGQERPAYKNLYQITKLGTSK